VTRPTCSLVVSTYNWPEALAAVLASVERQRVLPDEVVVADDGSRDTTRQLVEAAAARFPVPLRHVWQPDDGFRLAQIRNRANAAARGDYIVQIDGDMVLHPAFVADHLAAARAGQFIGGSRVLLDPEASRRVLGGDAALGPFSPGVRNRLNALRLPAAGAAVSRVLAARGLRSIRGGNMSYWRADFVAVNGYDEAYVGWGREDTDLVVRLLRAGRTRRLLKLAGVAYHLHHRENARTDLEQNEEILRRAMAAPDCRCERGVAQYL
jgi:glycosyltransferase involved in cell wall biosynthesis